MRYTDYTEAVLQIGAFDYQSIRDGQLHIENRVSFGAAVCTIIIGMFFPPVGLALGTILGGVQIVSVANGKDLISGRELSTGEQITRATFGTISIVGGVYGLNAFSQNTAFVRGTEPGTLNHYREMLKHSSKSNYIQLNQEAQVMHSMSTAPVLPNVENVSSTKQTASAFGEMSELDAKAYQRYWDRVEGRIPDEINGLKVINRKVNGEIPVEEYYDIRDASIHNTGSDSMTLGKWMDGKVSYLDRAKDKGSMFFDLGEEWGVIQKNMDLRRCLDCKMIYTK